MFIDRESLQKSIISSWTWSNLSIWILFFSSNLSKFGMTVPFFRPKSAFLDFGFCCLCTLVYRMFDCVLGYFLFSLCLFIATSFGVICVVLGVCFLVFYLWVDVWCECNSYCVWSNGKWSLVRSSESIFPSLLFLMLGIL